MLTVSFLRRALAAVLCLIPLFALGAPLTEAQIEKICAEADDSAHCGRLVEKVQLKRLPNLAQRKGNALLVSLFPAGTATFTDSDDAVSGRSYSLWDYLDGINAVLLYTTEGDNVSFTLLQRAGNRRFEFPAEPHLSPDGQRLLTADFCAQDCVNEVAVWRVSADGVRKELVWTPAEAWADASAQWKDADAVKIEYTAGEKSGTLERKLADPAWKRVPPP